jgi:outer membrane protein OmpA-like peptidoglycan-associated protein
MEHKIKTLFLCTLLFLTGCAAISKTDPPTGNLIGPVIGGAAGAGTAAVLGASKPFIGVTALAGAGLGYYLTTLRFSASGIIANGGKVYVLGGYVIINIPTDNLFDTNTSDFLPGTEATVDSIASVLNRYPGNNIFISGNTSGFWTARFEKKISEDRAAQLASALWARGVTNSVTFKKDSNDLNDDHVRRLIYIGYGDEFPVANNIRIKGIRANSHIQIVASPARDTLYWDKCLTHFKTFDNVNVGEANNTTTPAPDKQDYSQYAYAFADDK